MNVIYALEPKHVAQLHQLYQNEWWTKGRSLQDTAQCVAGSQICLGLTDECDDLIAFARVLTDYTFKALIFDVIVTPTHRGRGLGMQLLSLVKSHPKLQAVRHFELYCLPEMIPFYEQHGFSSEVGEIKLMRLSPHTA